MKVKAMPSLDAHVNTPPQLVMSLRSMYPSPHEHSKDPNVFVQVWLQGLVGTHSSLSIGNNNRTIWMNLIYSKKLHCNTRTFLYHLTNTCLLIKSVQNKASGTEALLQSINDCTGARATTITSTRLIGCSENRVSCDDYSTVLFVLIEKQKFYLTYF